MEVAVIGTGFIGGTLGSALSRAGHHVRFGSRHPNDDPVAEGTDTRVVTITEALDGADAVILAVPGPAVSDLVADHGHELSGHLVVDATNRMGAPVANSRADLPPDVRYARAFNTLGGEVMAQPRFADGPADLFCSAPEADRATVETLVEGVGLRPIVLGPDTEDIVDSLFRLWIALVPGHGRRHALRLLEE
jgi:predicted dinucleotide-binding enzyme